MDKRTITTALVCFLIFFGWQKLYLEPQNKQQGSPVSGAQTEQPPQSAPPSTTATSASVFKPAKKLTPKETPLQTLTLGAATGSLVLSNADAILSDWDLNQYKGINLTQITHPREL